MAPQEIGDPDTGADVFRDGRVHVRATPCHECLLGPNRLVSGGRAREIIRHTRYTDAASFICHRHQVSDEPASICSAWFDRYAEEDRLLQLAKRVGIVTRVEVDDE